MQKASDPNNSQQVETQFNFPTFGYELRAVGDVSLRSTWRSFGYFSASLLNHKLNSGDRKWYHVISYLFFCSQKSPITNDVFI